MSPPWACGLLAFLLTRQANQPLHLKDFAQHIGTKALSHAAHHVRRAEQAGMVQKIGWVGGWGGDDARSLGVSLSPAVSGYDLSCQVIREPRAMQLFSSRARPSSPAAAVFPAGILV
jgi:hypothetical protein